MLTYRPTHGPAQEAQVVVSGGIVRLQSKTLPIFADRAIQIVLGLQGEREIVMRGGVARLQTNGMPIGCNRLIELPLLAQRHAQIVMNRGKLR